MQDNKLTLEKANFYIGFTFPVWFLLKEHEIIAIWFLNVFHKLKLIFYLDKSIFVHVLQSRVFIEESSTDGIPAHNGSKVLSYNIVHETNRESAKFYMVIFLSVHF